MLNSNGDDNKLLIVLAFLFAVLCFFHFGSMRVNAHSLDLSGYDFEYLDEDDKSLGIIYYEKDEAVEENVVNTFPFVGTQGFDGEDDEYEDYLRNSNFTNYPYWVMYLDTIYVSDYPFVFGGEDNLLYAYDFDNEINVSYDSYKLGVSSGLYSIFSIGIPFENHSELVRSNHDIIYLSGGVGNLKSVKEYETPSYSLSDYPYVMRFGYYTIISKEPLLLRDDNNSEIITGLFYSDPDRKVLIAENNIKYSYLGTDFRSPIDRYSLYSSALKSNVYRYGFSFENPYPSYNNFLSLLGILNYDMYRGRISSFTSEYYDVFFEFMNPPNEWQPFDPSYVYPPGEHPGPGGEDPDEGGSILDILDYLNPFSDKFFLWIAFVPSGDFFVNEIERMVSSNDKLLSSFDNIKSSLEQVFSTELGTKSFDGIEYGARKLEFGTREIYVHGAGVVPPLSCKNPEKISGGLVGSKYRCSLLSFDLSGFKLVDASYISAFISRFRYWVGAVMQFLFMIWLVNWILSLFGYHMPKGGYR